MQISLTHAALDALLLELLADGKPRTPRQIHEPNDLNPAAARASLLRLVRADLIVRHGVIGSYVYCRPSPAKKERRHARARRPIETHAAV